MNSQVIALHIIMFHEGEKKKGIVITLKYRTVTEHNILHCTC